MDKKCTYDNVPVSEKTRDGMTLNINDISYIGRMFSLQDNCFEQQLEEMETRITKSLVDVLLDYNKNILDRLDAIQTDIRTVQTDIQLIQSDIKDIKNDIISLYTEISDLQKRVNKMEKRILELEKKVNVKSNLLKK